MDDNSVTTDNTTDASVHDHFDLSVACIICQRTVSSDAESEDLLAISLCGDCKFLLLEEYRTQTDDTHRRTPSRDRSRHPSSESIENFLSQQFSETMSPATQRQPVPRLRTTPSGSRRWRRVVSDTESDGFDSLYQESESLGAYGGDSDASVDGHGFLDVDMFNPPSDLDSDTDIDPMHAGPNQWNSDDHEEEDDDEEESNGSLLTWQAQLRSPEFEGVVSVRISERRRRTQTPTLSANSGDYLDARGFNELLERLAEADNSRQGAPPASVLFVNTLPRLVINEGHLKHDSLTCAVCKDSFSLGGVVNQLPCLHLYHPPCILPWLRARNTCPLCRYELPTDDKDYEERKRSVTNLNEEDDSSSSDENYEAEVDGFTNEYFARDDEDGVGGSRRGNWLLLAAAPIASIVGFVIVMWLKSPRDLPRGPQLIHSASSWTTNQRENRSRRWWSLF